MRTVERGKSWLLAAWLPCAVAASGCLQASPFESDLADEDRDQNARNLERLGRSPVRGEPLRFALLSDSHQAYDELAAVLDVIDARGDVDFVVHLGDQTEQGLRQEYLWTLERLRELEVPFFVALGNHDTLSNGRHVYREMYGRYDFSFEHRGLRVVIMNGNELEFEGAAPDLAWLDEATAPSDEASAVVVLAHQRPGRDDYAAILRDNGVSALITAHFHRTGAELIEGVPALMIGSTQDRRWGLVTATDDGVMLQTCTGARCTENEP